jgi:nucleotide-binding universal stress UspA family protein
MIVALGPWISIIPMAALVAVMIMVSIGTFSWGSLKDLRKHPKTSSLVMITTVAVVVLTHNLAIGVAVGVLMSVVSFARKAALLVASRQFKPIERFLVAYDGGPSVEKAIQFAIEQPLLKGLSCHLLRAGRIDADAKWYLEEAAEKMRAAGYVVSVEAEPGHPEEVIAHSLERQQIDLIIMGAYGHSRIRHLIIGSTTTEVLRTCRVPVLMFR